MNTSDTDPQSATQAQLTLPSWHHGGDLTRLEEEMRAKAAAGELVGRGEGPFDHADMRGWGKERVIRAAVLRYLLAADDWPVDVKGIRLRGVRISGHLDLEGVTLRCALLLEDCYLDASEPVCLDHATAYRLALTRCHLAGLTGEMLSAREVNLLGSTLTGPLQVLGADITGQLICGGAKLTGHNNDGYALVGDGMKVGGDVFLGQEFTAAGAIWLPGADITGQLNCGGAKLTGQDNDGNALVGDRMKVGGSVFLHQEFTAAGAIWLPGADITGQLNCGGAKLTGHNNDGNALVGDRMKVGGSVFLHQEFTAAGAIVLPGADITGQLNCGGAKLTGQNNDGYALVGDRVKVGGDVFLDQEFTAAGAIGLLGADITGQLSCGGAKLTGQDNDGDALVGDGMKVGGDVFLDQEFTAAGGSLSGRYVSAGRLRFSRQHWLAQARLRWTRPGRRSRADLCGHRPAKSPARSTWRAPPSAT